MCGKLHYNAAVKMVNKHRLPITSQSIYWIKDGKSGKTDPLTSEHLAMRFMTTPNMVEKCRMVKGGK